MEILAAMTRLKNAQSNVLTKNWLSLEEYHYHAVA
jgi:hypothetical protein